MTADEIVIYLAARGVRVSTRQVISARRAGLLPYRRAGHAVRSSRSDVDEWLADGCESPDYAPERQGPPRDDMTDEECVAARLRGQTPQATVRWIMRLRTERDAANAARVLATAEARSARIEAQHATAASLELESRCSVLEGRLRRQGGRVDS